MHLKIAKPSTEAERTTQTTLDTIEITPDLVRSWKLPPFQRPLRTNDKLVSLSQEIARNDGIVPGVLTLGVLDKQRWLIDGQHRREAFLLSDCLTGYVDVRICHFSSMAEMGEEFVNLNSRIVQMRPDDILRGLEESYPALLRIKKACPFVGYDQIRRSDKGPVLSMSALLRCWYGSVPDVPAGGGTSALRLATTLTNDDADQCSAFLNDAFRAWGRDQAYFRLWGNLNLTLCMWLHRRLVIASQAPGSRVQRLSRDQFTKCMMSLSASDYVDWLLGRNSQTRDNSPAYMRIKAVFAKRLEADLGHKVALPSPAWSSK